MGGLEWREKGDDACSLGTVSAGLFTCCVISYLGSSVVMSPTERALLEVGPCWRRLREVDGRRVGEAEVKLQSVLGWEMGLGGAWLLGAVRLF